MEQALPNKNLFNSISYSDWICVKLLYKLYKMTLNILSWSFFYLLSKNSQTLRCKKHSKIKNSKLISLANFLSVTRVEYCWYRLEDQINPNLGGLFLEKIDHRFFWGERGRGGKITPAPCLKLIKITRSFKFGT